MEIDAPREIGWYVLKRERTSEWPFVKAKELEGPFKSTISATLNEAEIEQGLIICYWDGQGWNTGRP
jgi:hypothetical protein